MLLAFQQYLGLPGPHLDARTHHTIGKWSSCPTMLTIYINRMHWAKCVCSREGVLACPGLQLISFLKNTELFRCPNHNLVSYPLQQDCAFLDLFLVSDITIPHASTPLPSLAKEHTTQKLPLVVCLIGQALKRHEVDASYLRNTSGASIIASTSANFFSYTIPFSSFILTLGFQVPRCCVKYL